MLRDTQELPEKLAGYGMVPEQPCEGWVEGVERTLAAKAQQSPAHPGTYRGYLLKTNPMTADLWVEKDGHIICRASRGQSLEWAKAQSDALAGQHN